MVKEITNGNPMKTSENIIRAFGVTMRKNMYRGGLTSLGNGSAASRVFHSFSKVNFWT